MAACIHRSVVLFGVVGFLSLGSCEHFQQHEVLEASDLQPHPIAEEGSDVKFVETAPPPAPAPVPQAVNKYTVRRGDTLWSIALRTYGDGHRWRDIIAANPGLDPKKLRVGQTLVMP